MEHPALECARIFHADHHAGEQAFKHPRRREIVGRADFLQVDGDGGRRLGAVHHVAADQPLRIAEDVLADPRRRQVGQHLLFGAQLVEFGTGLAPVDQRGVRVHHALGVAGGARGEEHRRHIGGLDLVDLAPEKLGVLRGKDLAGGDQLVQPGQAVLDILAQAARIVKEDVRELRTFLAHLQHLVDLLLVFHQGEAHVRVGDREDAFGGHRILVQRHRNRAERLRGEHGGVQARTVGAHDDDVFVALQAGLVQAAGNLLHQRGHVSPAMGLPDAIFFFAHGGRAGALGGVFEQKSGERGQHCRYLVSNFEPPRNRNPGSLLCPECRPAFDVMLSFRRQSSGVFSQDFP